MKKTTLTRLTLALALLLVALSLFTACSAKTDIGEVDDLTEDYLDYLLADDYAKAYDLLKENVTDADFKPYWDAMRTATEGATDYELEQIGWQINTKNGVTTHSAAFTVTLNNDRSIFVRTVLVEGQSGIGGISFHETTEFEATTGTYAPIINIVLMIVSILIMAFTVWTLVDCARRKIKVKALWIIVILLGFTLTLTIGAQSGLTFGFGLFFTLSQAIADPSLLALTLKLNIPLGAILYLILRKRLTPASAPEAPIVEAPIAEPTSSETPAPVAPTTPDSTDTYTE